MNVSVTCSANPTFVVERQEILDPVELARLPLVTRGGVGGLKRGLLWRSLLVNFEVVSSSAARPKRKIAGGECSAAAGTELPGWGTLRADAAAFSGRRESERSAWSLP